MVNIPLVENVLALRATAFVADNEGYYDNTYLNKDNQEALIKRAVVSL